MPRKTDNLASEPTLQEVFDDPIVHLVMRRDGLTPERVMAELMPIARHLMSRSPLAVHAAA